MDLEKRVYLPNKEKGRKPEAVQGMIFQHLTMTLEK